MTSQFQFWIVMKSKDNTIEIVKLVPKGVTNHSLGITVIAYKVPIQAKSQEPSVVHSHQNLT